MLTEASSVTARCTLTQRTADSHRNAANNHFASPFYRAAPLFACAQMQQVAERAALALALVEIYLVYDVDPRVAAPLAGTWPCDVAAPRALSNLVKFFF